ncbi:MAG: hypothetical protein ACRDGM_18040 [bacterium]
MSLRSRGIHWPTGAVLDPLGNENNEWLWRRLRGGAPTVMTEDSAKWQWALTADACPGSLVMWRVMPLPDQRPAKVFWDAQRVVDNALVNMREHAGRSGRWPTDIQWLNELSLNYERGDNLNDLDSGTWRYVIERTCQMMGGILDIARNHPDLRKARHYFPPWAPGHGHHDNDLGAVWIQAAKRFDGAVLHAYTDSATIEAEIHWYEMAVQILGPDGYRLVLGEWDCDGYGGDWNNEERNIIATLDRKCAANPNLFACYFIERWAGGPRGDFNIYGSAERSALWAPDTRPALQSDGPVTPPNAPPPPPPRTAPTRADVIAASNAAADSFNIPRLLMLACGIAESGLNYDAERWGDKSRFAKASIASGDLAGLQTIMDDLAARNLQNDISFGAWQQSWRYVAASESDGRYTMSNILSIRNLYFGLTRAAAYAAHQLLARLTTAQTLEPSSDQQRHIVMALNLYNWPAGQGKPKNAKVLINYAVGIEEAKKILATDAPPVGGNMPKFVLGFKDVADRFGHDVVGDPVADEENFNPADWRVQRTTKGLLLWHKSGVVQPGFVPFA